MSSSTYEKSISSLRVHSSLESSWAIRRVEWHLRDSLRPPLELECMQLMWTLKPWYMKWNTFYRWIVRAVKKIPGNRLGELNIWIFPRQCTRPGQTPPKLSRMSMSHRWVDGYWQIQTTPLLHASTKISLSFFFIFGYKALMQPSIAPLIDIHF